MPKKTCRIADINSCMICGQLAEVLERARPDYSVIIWDVHSAPSYDISIMPERKASAATVDSSFYASWATAELCMYADLSFLVILCSVTSVGH